MENNLDQNNYQNYQQPYQNGNGNFMIQKLPNTTVSMVLGIISIVCCCSIVVGIICGIIGIVLANRDIKLYQTNPQQYTGVENANTAKILNIIGIVLSVFNLLYSIYGIMSVGGWDAYMIMIQDAVNQAQQGQY